MSAKSDARKEFAKEQEIEKLREKKAAQTSFLASLSPEELAARKKSGNKKLLIGAGIVVAIIIAIAASSGSNNDTSSPSTSTTTTATTTPVDPADAGAQLGCDHFRNVMGDASKGLLTDAELRTKIKEVYSDAYISASPDIATTATAMLAADTAGDVGAFTTALKAFGAACSALGH